MKKKKLEKKTVIIVMGASLSLYFLAGAGQV